MFETLDIIVSLAVVFLILSMIHKYLISMIKRLFKVKASVIAEEMKIFIGEKTAPYLIKYIQEKAKHLNILEGTRSKTGLKKGEFGFRQMNKEQLKAVIEDLREFLDSNTLQTINGDLNLGITQVDVDEVKVHLGKLRGRIEKMYDNTLEKISEMYESRLRTFTIVCGLILALAINADFFNIYGTLSTNAVSREKLITNTETIRVDVAKLNTKLDGHNDEEIKNIKQEIQDAGKNIAGLTTNFKEAGLLLGWTEQRFSDAISSPGSAINKVLGLLLSGLLISFGAPFWNDFLSSLMGVRKLLYGKGRERSNSAPKGLKVP